MSEETKKAPPLRFKGFSDAWEQRKLGENVIIKSGWSPSNFVRTNSEGSELFIKVDDLNYSSREQNDSQMRVHDNPRFQKMKKGSIIFPKRGAAIMTNKVRILGSDGYMDTNMMALDPQGIDAHFLYTFIARTGLYKIADTSTIPQINNKHIEPYIVYCPSIEEQIKVGSFFKKLDDTIALHQEKQRQIRSLKQGFIKNLFPNNKNSAPRIRFAIFNDDWNQRSASEIFTSVADKNYPELPVLSASQEKGMVLRESNGINIKYDQKSTGTYKRVLPGQFIMHLRSFQGGFAYSTIEGITSPAYTILAFRNKEDHYPLFWKSIFSSKNFIKRLEAITYGIRDGRSISYADFSTLRFWIPSYEEQKQIGDFLESIDATIAFYQRQIDMMQSLKKELLNNMFI